MPFNGFVPGTHWCTLWPKILFMLTMCPRTSRSFIDLIDSRVQRHKPIMFVSIIFLKSFKLLQSVNSDLVITPALFTNKSIPPYFSVIHLYADNTDASCVISHSIAFNWPVAPKRLALMAYKRFKKFYILPTSANPRIHGHTHINFILPSGQTANNHASTYKIHRNCCSNSTTSPSYNSYSSLPLFHLLNHTDERMI